MRNKATSADHSRTNEIHVLWMEEPWHYTGNKLPPRSPDEYGPTLDIPDSELLALTQLALEAYNMPRWLPVPPTGVPGVPSWQKPDDEVMDLIREGARYMVAYLNGERRTLCNIHEKIEDRLRRARENAAEEARLEIFREIASRADNRPDPREGEVYFIRSEAGPIKIGKARDPQARLRGLQTSHFAKLEIAATCGGGLDREAEYHARFAEHRLEGEWFEPHPDILAEIERLTQDGNNQ